MNHQQLIDELASIPIARVWNRLFETSHEEEETINISCPLHGSEDKKPSARIYEDSNKVFCWGCGKVRDSVQLIRDALALHDGTSPTFDDVVQWAASELFATEVIKETTQENVQLSRLALQAWLRQRALFLEDTLFTLKNRLSLETYAISFYSLDLLNYYSETWSEESLMALLERTQKRIVNEIMQLGRKYGKKQNSGAQS